MHLGALIKPDLIFVGLPGSDRPTVLKAMADGLAARSVLAGRRAALRAASGARRLGSTGIGGGVAIPHCKMKDLDESDRGHWYQPRGVDFAADDNKRFASCSWSCRRKTSPQNTCNRCRRSPSGSRVGTGRGDPGDGGSRGDLSAAEDGGGLGGRKAGRGRSGA